MEPPPLRPRGGRRGGTDASAAAAARGFGRPATTASAGGISLALRLPRSGGREAALALLRDRDGDAKPAQPEAETQLAPPSSYELPRPYAVEVRALIA